jgi:arylsulfatase A-like enzyme
MNRRCFLKAVCLGAVALVVAGVMLSGCGETISTTVGRQDRPNVVIIFMDDMGYADVGCYGAEGFETPHMDRMAKEGLKLTDFYVAASVCTPSRAALLTGCYPQRVGKLGVLFPDRTDRPSKKGLNPDETTIAEMLKAVGYKTALVGKWHLGDKPPFLPCKQGFDEYFGLPYSNDMRKGRNGMPPLPLIEGDKTIEEEPDQTYLTKRYTERAVRFIAQQKDKPFFLYLAHSMPHVPIFASEAFKGTTKRGLYGDVIAELDWSVGQVLQALKDNGIDEKTLVILTSDNGPWLTQNEHGGKADPLRGAKMTVYDGGLRVPCLIRWPGTIKGGKTSAEIASTIDLLPTLANLCGAELPEKEIDGIDLTDFLIKGKSSPRKTFHYGLGVVRQGKWKLFLPGKYAEIQKNDKGRNKKVSIKYDTVRLYDLEADIGETKNVAGEHPEIVDRLTKLIKAHGEEMKNEGRAPGLLK